jgi:putative FmdB family regulatory protein
MPLFDFECQSCHEQFEELVFASTQVRCPKCANLEVKKLPSRVSIGRGGSGRAAAPSFPAGGG